MFPDVRPTEMASSLSGDGEKLYSYVAFANFHFVFHGSLRENIIYQMYRAADKLNKMFGNRDARLQRGAKRNSVIKAGNVLPLESVPLVGCFGIIKNFSYDRRELSAREIPHRGRIKGHR